MLQLPTEVQTLIFFECDQFEDAQNLRLTCRHLASVYKESERDLKVLLFLRCNTYREVLEWRMYSEEFGAVYQKFEEQILAQVARNMLDPLYDFYEFLQELKFDDDTIVYPPPGGWPEITQEVIAAYRKSDFAIQVLKHLPQLKSGDWSSVGYKSSAIDYRSMARAPQQSRDSDLRFLSRMEEEYAPTAAENDDNDSDDEFFAERDRLQDIIHIFNGHESFGEAILLDTMDGIMYEDLIRAGPGCSMSLEDFCCMQENSFTALEEVFGPNDEPVKSYDKDKGEDGPDWDTIGQELEAAGEPKSNDGRYLWIGHLYTKHGWPGEDYDKEACKKAVAEFWSRTE